jgi:hypothetical protein
VQLARQGEVDKVTVDLEMELNRSNKASAFIQRRIMEE